MPGELVPIIIVPVIFSVPVIIIALFLKAKERRLLIEKGLDTEQLKEFLEKKKNDSFTLLKIGMISIFLGLGLGFGMYLYDITDKDYWVVLCLFTISGIGFILANLISRKLEKTVQ